MEFNIGTIFEEEFYSEAHSWVVQQNNVGIEEIEPQNDVRMFQIVDTTPTEEQEQQRISMLSLTGADVERGIYKAKGMDFDDIIAYVTQLQPIGLDIKALKIELKANNFYRGNSYVDAVGTLLGFSKTQLDKFFEDGNYEHLLEVQDEAV